MEFSDWTRRRFLSTIGASASVLISGCTSGNPGFFGEDESGRATEIRLSDIIISNLHADSHTVKLKVEYNSDVIVDEIIHVEAATGNESSSLTVEKKWPTTPGEFVVRARVDNGRWEERNLAATSDAQTDCVRAMVRIMDDGTFGIWTSEKCPE